MPFSGGTFSTCNFGGGVEVEEEERVLCATAYFIRNILADVLRRVSAVLMHILVVTWVSTYRASSLSNVSKIFACIAMH